jgi:hypothetical protein
MSGDFTFTYTNNESRAVEHRMVSDSWQDVVDQMVCFLRGCGYDVTGRDIGNYLAQEDRVNFDDMVIPPEGYSFDDILLVDSGDMSTNNSTITLGADDTCFIKS